MDKPQNLGTEKLYGLDHLRALSISLVFFHHYRSDNFPDKILAIKNFGWVGVDLFFVLSGFLIARQLFAELQRRQSISLAKFFIKRFFRIVPVYLVVVAIYFLVPAFRERESLPALWKFLTFTQNIGLSPYTGGTFSHAWSLCVEEQFYILFPLVITAAFYLRIEKKGIYILLAFFLFTCLFRVYLWYQYMEPLINKGGNYHEFWLTWIYYPTYTRLDGLLTGIGIAGLVTYYPKAKEKLMRYGNLLLLAGILVLAAGYFICYIRVSFNSNIFGFPVIAIGFGCLVLAAISPGCVLYKLRSRLTTSVAILSYAVYLIHKAITHVCILYFGKMGLDEESYWMLLLSAVFTFIGALILRYTVEKPFLKLRDKLLVHKINPV